VSELPGELELPFSSAHMVSNALAALAAAQAVGARPHGLLDVQLRRHARPSGSSCPAICSSSTTATTPNPMSMRAALDDLAMSASGRKVAVLGDMLELGPEAGRYHEEIGAYAREAGADVLVTVGPLAERMADAFGGETHRAADAAEAAALTRELLAPG